MDLSKMTDEQRVRSAVPTAYRLKDQQFCYVWQSRLHREAWVSSCGIEAKDALGYLGADWEEALRHPLVQSGEAAQKPTEPAKHDLYTDADTERPKSICDRNGQVVLGLCKRCGKGECELDESCIPKPSSADLDAVAEEEKAREATSPVTTMAGWRREEMDFVLDKLWAIALPGEDIPPNAIYGIPGTPTQVDIEWGKSVAAELEPPQPSAERVSDEQLDVTGEDVAEGLKTANYALGPDGNAASFTGQLIVLIQSQLLACKRELLQSRSELGELRDSAKSHQRRRDEALQRAEAAERERDEFRVKMTHMCEHLKAAKERAEKAERELERVKGVSAEGFEEWFEGWGNKTSFYSAQTAARAAWTTSAAATEGRVRILHDACDRLLIRFRLLLASKPVRDVEETIAEAEHALLPTPVKEVCDVDGA